MARLSSLSGTRFWGVTQSGTPPAPPPPPALFEFSTFTFNTAGTVGRFGPTLSTLQSSYSSQPWASNSAFFTQGRAQGYQVFTIPQTGIYEIEAAGARGQDSNNIPGSRGRGAIIRARVSLTIGDKLEMVVGQVPGNNGSTNPSNSFAGAGGGSFVAIAGTNTPVIVAGGGGGSYSTYPSQAVVDGQTSQRPRFTGFNWSPAQDGVNPSIGQGGQGFHGGGGGGFFSAGQDYSGSAGSSAMSTGSGGQNFTHGAAFVGGSVSTGGGDWYAIGGNATALTSEGGFGGGGGGHSGNNTGGGGGGYSGGLGGQTSLGGSINTGMGGGSYIIPTATSIATSNGFYDASSVGNIGSFNDASGYVKITRISGGGGGGGGNVQLFTSTTSTSLAAGTYNYFMMGSGGSGAASHYPGGGAGRILTGSFVHGGGTVSITVAPASSTYANSEDANLSGIQGNNSIINYNGGTLTALGGDGGWGNAPAPGASLGPDPWASGSSGGGGGGNAGNGGPGGSGGSSGTSGTTYAGGTGMGTTAFNSAISFLQTGLRTTHTSATVTAGAGGAQSGGSHQGGGGGGGIIISNILGISTPTAIIGTTIAGHTHGQPGQGWGAGGGAAGFNGARGSTGQGVQGIVVIWQ